MKQLTASIPARVPVIIQNRVSWGKASSSLTTRKMMMTTIPATRHKIPRNRPLLAPVQSIWKYHCSINIDLIMVHRKLEYRLVILHESLSLLNYIKLWKPLLKSNMIDIYKSLTWEVKYWGSNSFWEGLPFPFMLLLILLLLLLAKAFLWKDFFLLILSRPTFRPITNVTPAAIRL